MHLVLRPFQIEYSNLANLFFHHILQVSSDSHHLTNTLSGTRWTLRAVRWELSHSLGCRLGEPWLWTCADRRLIIHQGMLSGLTSCRLTWWDLLIPIGILRTYLSITENFERNQISSYFCQDNQRNQPQQIFQTDPIYMNAHNYVQYPDHQSVS